MDAEAKQEIKEIKKAIKKSYGNRSTGNMCRVYRGKKQCEGFGKCYFHSGKLIHWLDHARLYNKSGIYTLISEPYFLTQDDIEELIRFCDKYGLKFSINPAAAIHYPGQTMAIVIKKLEN